MTLSLGVSVRGRETGARLGGQVWCDPPGSRQAWEGVMLGPGAVLAPCVVPAWALPWGGWGPGLGGEQLVCASGLPAGLVEWGACQL